MSHHEDRGFNPVWIVYATLPLSLRALGAIRTHVMWFRRPLPDPSGRELGVRGGQAPRIGESGGNWTLEADFADRLPRQRTDSQSG